MRPAHIHFLISAPGYRELVTALYIAGDEHLEDDVVFGASGDLVAEVKDSDPASPDQGRAQHPLRLQPRARERGRPARRPRRRRSGRHHRRQRQGDDALRRAAPGDAAPPSSRRRAVPRGPLPRASEHAQSTPPRVILGLVPRTHGAAYCASRSALLARAALDCLGDRSKLKAWILGSSAEDDSAKRAGREAHRLMKAPPFAYVRAASLADAFKLWSAAGPRPSCWPAGRRCWRRSPFGCPSPAR